MTNSGAYENNTDHQAMSEGTTSGDPSQGFLPCVARGKAPFTPTSQEPRSCRCGWVGKRLTMRTKLLADLDLEPKCNVSYCAFRLGFQNMFTHF